MVGMFARSMAGHDKNRLYIIIREESEYVYLSEGNLRTVEKPKKKKKKHIQIIKTESGLASGFLNGDKVQNEEVKRAIRQYRDEEMQEEKNVKSRCD